MDVSTAAMHSRTRKSVKKAAAISDVAVVSCTGSPLFFKELYKETIIRSPKIGRFYRVQVGFRFAHSTLILHTAPELYASSLSSTHPPADVKRAGTQASTSTFACDNASGKLDLICTWFVPVPYVETMIRP